MYTIALDVTLVDKDMQTNEYLKHSPDQEISSGHISQSFSSIVRDLYNIGSPRCDADTAETSQLSIPGAVLINVLRKSASAHARAVKLLAASHNSDSASKPNETHLHPFLVLTTHKKNSSIKAVTTKTKQNQNMQRISRAIATKTLLPRSTISHQKNHLFANMTNQQKRQNQTTVEAPISPSIGNLKGKVCFVTGGGSGIGEGICKKFAAMGAKVVVGDLRHSAAAQTVDKLEGSDHYAVTMDVTDENQVNLGMNSIIEKYGRLDVLVCNAGVQHISSVVDLEFENWRKILSVHLDAPFLCTKAALKHMYEQKSGKVIYIGSVHSKTASPLKAPYVSAKHGVLGLCRTVAKEAAKHNVSANVICPGFVLTPLVEKQIPEQAKELNISEEEVVQKIMLKDTVNGEFATVEDVANAAAFVAGFESNALTGQSFIVSNGWFME